MSALKRVFKGQVTRTRLRQYFHRLQEQLQRLPSERDRQQSQTLKDLLVEGCGQYPQPKVNWRSINKITSGTTFFTAGNLPDDGEASLALSSTGGSSSSVMALKPRTVRQLPAARRVGLNRIGEGMVDPDAKITERYSPSKSAALGSTWFQVDHRKNNTGTVTGMGSGGIKRTGPKRYGASTAINNTSAAATSMSPGKTSATGSKYATLSSAAVTAPGVMQMARAAVLAATRALVLEPHSSMGSVSSASSADSDSNRSLPAALQQYSLGTGEDVVTLLSMHSARNEVGVQWVPFGIMPDSSLLSMLCCTALAITSPTFSATDARRLCYIARNSRRYSSAWINIQALFLYGTRMGHCGVSAFLGMGVQRLSNLTIAHTGGLTHGLTTALGQQMMFKGCRLSKLYIEGERHFGDRCFVILMQSLQVSR